MVGDRGLKFFGGAMRAAADLLVDDVQEGAELARPMAGEAFAEDPAGGGVERSGQAEGSMGV